MVCVCLEVSYAVRPEDVFVFRDPIPSQLKKLPKKTANQRAEKTEEQKQKAEFMAKWSCAMHLLK